MYTVISQNDIDGLSVVSFETLNEAEAHANDVSAEGFTCTLYRQLRTYESTMDPTPEDFGVRPGIDYPYSLC